MSDDRLDEALRHLRYMGTRVPDHELASMAAVEAPPRARREAKCSCGWRSRLGSSTEVSRAFATHRRSVVIDGAQVQAVDGRLV